MTRPIRRQVVPVVAACLVAAVLAACVPQRSPEAFCDTYWEQKQEYVSKYSEAEEALEQVEDPLLGALGGAGMMAQAIGDVVIIFERLEAVAPEEIRPDVAAIRDSLKSQVDSAGEMATNPLGAIAGGLFSALATGGSWQRVSEYVVEQCGEQGPTG